MMTFDCIEITEELPDLKPVDDLMGEIKRMVSELLLRVQHTVAGGMLTVLLMGTMPMVSANAYLFTENKPEIIIDNSGVVPVAHDVATFYFHHERLTADIERLSVLKDGWDGNGAKAPSKEALKQMSSIVDMLDEQVLSFCAIFPENESGLYLQGRFPNGRLSVYLDGNLMTYLLKNKGNRISKSAVVVQPAAIKDLQINIVSLLLDENA